MGYPGVLKVVVVLFVLSSAEGLLTDLRQYRSLILLIHNFYRRYERAANMNELVWDTSLQKQAEYWSENCYWDHQNHGPGENLAYFWSSRATMETSDVIIKSCQNWWKEVNDWTWSSEPCGSACHYTQMIWGSTERIGCALSKCDNLRLETGASMQNAQYFVCFYDPPGNYRGQLPYTLGESCSRCSTGKTCNKGLCSTSVPQIVVKK